MNRHKIKTFFIKKGFEMFSLLPFHLLGKKWFRGQGVILTFHHVRPWENRTLDFNRGLEIDPHFLKALLVDLKDQGFEIISLDKALERIKSSARNEKPFAVLTFDDGYNDFFDYAYPLLREMQAPFTLFITTQFAQGTGSLWWIELEEAFHVLNKLHLQIREEVFDADISTQDQKNRLSKQVYWRLRQEKETDLHAVISDLTQQAGIDRLKLTRRLCMGWARLRELAQDPLCTLGAHSVSHARLASLSLPEMSQEMSESRHVLEDHIGHQINHFSYPIGDVSSAGHREFEEARRQGFTSGVTTRPGMIFSAHREALMALPRLSINGFWQNLPANRVLLSGWPSFLWNKGRRFVAF